MTLGYVACSPYRKVGRSGKAYFDFGGKGTWDDDLEPVLKSRALGRVPSGGLMGYFAHTLTFLYSTLLHLSDINKVGTKLWTSGRSRDWMDRTVTLHGPPFLWFAVLLYKCTF
jgi:hypothetical protein